MTEENVTPHPAEATTQKPRRSESKRKKGAQVASQNEGQEEDELLEFAGRAIHGQRGGAFETLFSQMLASSVVVTDPLKRIKIVCETALMVREESREDLKIDYDRIKVLNQVTNALLTSTAEHRKDWDIDVVSVPWPFSFTEESYTEFIAPWIVPTFQYWPVLMRNHCKWHWHCDSSTYRYQAVIDEIIENPMWSWFFDASKCLTPQGFNIMKNAFAAWAIPQVQMYLATLTEIVSPSLYSEILGLYKNRKKSYAEKVKQTTETSTSEDNMDAEL
jgi:hypothetical protein